MQTKVPVTEKIAIILASVCYVFTIYSFFTQTYLVVMVFFVLHSIFALYAIYIAFLSRADTSEFQVLCEELDDLKTAKKAMETELNDKLTQREQELSDLRTELDSLSTKADDMTSKNRILSDSLQELTRENDIQKTRNLLPPADDDKKETLDIIAVARDVIAQMSEYAKSADLTVTISSEGNELLVSGNRTRMEVLFKNIIDNTIKYAKRAGNLVITISTIGDDIFIVLKDNGEGLSQEETSHIFELNYQGSNRISGNGLGLAQAKAIVEYYGGTIYAKSTPGKGMGVYIQLPATQR